MLDILRGWAIFGILLVDIDALHTPDAGWTALDRVVYRGLDLFASSKFWTLLSFLFGLGFSLLVMRAANPRFLQAFSRRMVALIAIGVLQIVFLMWGGHYLVRYGVLGFLLLPVRRLASRHLLVAAVVAMLVSWSYSMIVDVVRERRLAQPQTAAEVMRAEAEQKAARDAFHRERDTARQAGYAKRAAFQVKGFYLSYFTGLFIGSGWAYLTWLSQFAMFLVGFYVGRRRILHDIPAHLPLLRRVLIWGLVVGFAIAAVRYLVPASADQPLATRHLLRLLGSVGDPALAFAYGAGLVLLAEKGWCQRLLRALAPPGRMALTNYLLMAVLVGVLAPAFQVGVYSGPGYLGISPTVGVLAAVAVYAVLTFLSKWWLALFRFGPAEWLWRSATYWKWQPMRLASRSEAAAIGGAP